MDNREERLEDIKDKVVDKINSLLDRIDNPLLSYERELQTAITINNLANTLVSLGMSNIEGDDL